MSSLEEKLRRIASETPAYRPREKSADPVESRTFSRIWQEEARNLPMGSQLPDEESVTVLLSGQDTEWELENTIFLDTETTGLSGGVGTLAFLIGLGYYRSGSFIVEQYFMEDYDKEPEILLLLAEKLKSFTHIVTYNGKSFDVPILNSRSLMNRVYSRTQNLTHIDLLYACRRLFKRRIGSCSLGNIEEQVLNMKREGDIPGAMAPVIFFEYLKSGDMTAMEGIIEHNRQDIVSLFSLLCRVCSYIEYPQTLADEQDQFSLGVLFENSGYPDEAAQCYLRAFRLNEAVAAYGRLMKRAGESEKAQDAWQTLIARQERSILPYVELAKIYEHCLKDYSSALGIVDVALAQPGLNASDRWELQRRRERIQLKEQKKGESNQ